MSGPNVGRPWTGPLRGECSVCGKWFTLRWSKTDEGVKVVARHKVRGEVCPGADKPCAKEEAASRTSARRTIDRIRDVLSANGWCKENSGDEPEGEHCVMGALDLCRGKGAPLAGRTLSWLAHELGYVTPYCPVALFNDAPDTEYEDVLAFLDLAEEVLS